MFKAPFSFNGRIRRIEYFLSGLISSLVGGIVWTIAFASMFVGIAAGDPTAAAGGSIFAILIGIAAYIAIVWFGLAQGTKRLHDMDKSGWLILLLLVPILNVFWGLYMLFADGTVGPNQFGEDPKNRMPYQGAAPASPINVTVNINKEEVKAEPASTTTTTIVEETVEEEKKAE